MYYSAEIKITSEDSQLIVKTGNRPVELAGVRSEFNPCTAKNNIITNNIILYM